MTTENDSKGILDRIMRIVVVMAIVVTVSLQVYNSYERETQKDCESIITLLPPSESSMTTYWISEYVKSRENFVVEYLVENYNRVRVFSERYNVYPEFVKVANPNNPNSNAARLGLGGSRIIKVENIELLNNEEAEIIYNVTEKTYKDNIPLRSGYKEKAHLKFAYKKQLLLMPEEVPINPMKLQIIYYKTERVDEN